MHAALIVTLFTTLAGAEPVAAFPQVHPDSACPSRNVPLQGRKSPLDSVSFTVSGQPVKVCYGRPSSRGRVMLGGKDVPYGKIWRTGANEPTIFFAAIPLTVAGLRVDPGVYSIYTVPGPKEWQIIVNRSTSQWGKEDEYTDAIRAKEVGRAKVKSESTGTPVETFTIRAEPKGSKADLVLEWEKTRVRIPFQRAS
jgi:hypothetical protein